MNCTRIKRIIDEADRPDVFPLEAAGHVAGCPDCRSFADERARLRELTGSVARVTAPGNFNALLNERLSRVKSQRSSWLSPAGFMRLGTATAGLLVVFMALQYSGFLSAKKPTEVQRQELANDGARVKEPDKSTPFPPVPVDAPRPPTVASGDRTARSASWSKSSFVPASRTPRGTRQEGPPLLLVRDHNGDRTLPMIPVSVGMQQVLNASYGRQQPRSSDISY
jgi:hypothetical protein